MGDLQHAAGVLNSLHLSSFVLQLLMGDLQHAAGILDGSHLSFLQLLMGDL